MALRRNTAARSIGSALAAGLALMRVSFARGADRRRLEQLLTELVQQLALMTEEIHRANLTQYYRLIADQNDRKLDDPTLAEASSTLGGLSDARRRQMIFANQQYGSLVLAHRVGVIGWDELLGHLRVLCINSVFAEYWDRTVDHRRSLPPDSVEAKIGATVDVMMEELAEEPDEWWVVGSVPESEPEPEPPAHG
ncbi:DUF6082 family protein [Streptomyces sp. NPDC047043]|uniref:DUF6082 family protein n=1 Tax=Streptomyces sp. NPDC047043 TaxID=3154497 RepID=UPI0033FADC8A